jgi:hypothetical protein
LLNVVRVIEYRRMRGVEHVKRVTDTRNAYLILDRKCENCITLGRPRYRWENDADMDFGNVH